MVLILVSVWDTYVSEEKLEEDEELEEEVLILTSEPGESRSLEGYIDIISHLFNGLIFL